MTKVFIGGSRHLSRLAAPVRLRLDRIMERDLPVLLGDAYGVDRAAQLYLHDRNYPNVEIFCSGDQCRNNVGRWHTHMVTAGPRSRGFAFFAAKDREMARQATVGLMVWDGRSTGTLLNVLRLLHRGKKAVLYCSTDQAFVELSALDQWAAFIGCHGAELQAEIDARLTHEDLEEATASQPTLALLP